MRTPLLRAVTVTLGAVLSIGLVARAEPSTQLPPPPQVHVVDQVDDYHGTPVRDPYRWLEDESLPETQAFIAAQNARTRVFLDSPVRDALEKRLTELLDYPRQTTPVRRGALAFFSTNTGLQNQNVLRVTEQIGAPGRVLVDPNTLSEDGTVSLGGTSFTKDGTLMTYGLARGGSDHSEIRVKNVVTGEDLPDVIPPARQGGVAWKHDKSGFYYGRFPKTTEHGRNEQAYNYKLHFHKLGTPVEQDVLIYERPDDPEMSFGISITDDGKYEIMRLSRGTKRENRLYWRPADSTGDWNKLIDVEEHQYEVIENDGPVFYVYITDGAPRGRVVAIDVTNPAREQWKELIPQAEDVLTSVDLINEKFVVVYRRDARGVLAIHNKDGSRDREVPLPTVGSVGGVSAQRTDTDFFYSFTSYTYPSTIFRYDLKTNEQTVHFAPELNGFDPAGFETVQKFAVSKDGTRVPVFITHKKGLKRDGSNPALLAGYGGFNVSTSPGFSSTRLAWLERGGVFAQACIRGGGEYGDEWHKAGMLDKKQNVFDDFHAAAQLLVDEGFTSSKRLAIQGGSNGGLLVAACVLQRPELYGAVICQVPVADMLRFHKLGIGRFWTVEYGNAEASAEHFRFLHAYSPLHNIKPGMQLPPILITTGEGDNRVVPGHSYKLAAALQANASGANPILLRVEPKAGHGGGKPTSKVIAETADVYAFLFKVFGVN